MSQSKLRSGKTAHAAKPGATGKEDSSPNQQRAKPGLVSKVPSILFEGDQPTSSPDAPVQKYAVAPASRGTVAVATEPKLPEAYGTEKLGVIPRDPHCLYVFWDVTRDQQLRYFEGSQQRELFLRVDEHPGSGRPVNELRTDLQSRSWFVLVPRGGVNYRVSLGFHQAKQGWVSVAVSDVIRTPSGEVSAEREARFMAVVDPPAVSAGKQIPPRVAALPIRGSGIGEFSATIEQWEAALPEQAEFDLGLPPVETWSLAREQALEKLIHIEAIRREWISSLEIAQLISRQHLESEAVPSQLGGISSPLGGPRGGPREFWFNLNAELVVYGATDPNARVTIGAREIKLRPDGTFSYRFALPDGSYDLPTAAISADGETRAALLRFVRQTEYHAEIGAHPQDPALKPPSPNH